MTTFYVGQRVRIVWTRSSTRRPGTEATIIEPLQIYKTDLGDELCHRVDIVAADGNGYLVTPDQLEPITKLDDTATTWDEMPCDQDGKFRVGVPA